MKKFYLLIVFFIVPLFSESIPKNAKIYVAGHNGLVGRAIIRHLELEGFTNLLTKTHDELNLINQQETEDFFAQEKPEYVFLAAAKVGGILANNTQKSTFLYDNVMIEMNVLFSAQKYGAKKVLYLGSSCIYPRHCPQPIKEEYLLTGPLEPTNDAYAIAKIAGLMLAQAYHALGQTEYVCLMPTNLYGPFDNFNLQSSHVFPALIRRFVEAKERQDPTFTLWGQGQALREFLHVDDLAAASLFLMENCKSAEAINVGWGKDISILALAQKIKSAVGYEGEIVFDATKPDGMPRKLLDISRLKAYGFTPKISLEDGIAQTVQWYKENR